MRNSIRQTESASWVDPNTMPWTARSRHIDTGNRRRCEDVCCPKRNAQSKELKGRVVLIYKHIPSQIPSILRIYKTAPVEPIGVISAPLGNQALHQHRPICNERTQSTSNIRYATCIIANKIRGYLCNAACSNDRYTFVRVVEALRLRRCRSFAVGIIVKGRSPKRLAEK